MNYLSLTNPNCTFNKLAYAVWAGIGAVGTVLLGIFVFHEPVTFWRLLFLSLLVFSIVGLQITTSHH